LVLHLEQQMGTLPSLLLIGGAHAKQHNQYTKDNLLTLGKGLNAPFPFSKLTLNSLSLNCLCLA